MDFCVGKWWPNRVASVFLLVLLLSSLALGQESASPTFSIAPANQTGTPEGGSFEGVNESINLQNGNVSIAIPLLHLPGVAGHDLDLTWLVNSKVISMGGGQPPTYAPDTGGTNYTPPAFGSWGHPSTAAFGGGSLNIPVLEHYQIVLPWSSTDAAGAVTNFFPACTVGYVFYDSTGATHSFNNLAHCVGAAHPFNPEVSIDESSDGAFYRLDTSSSTEDVVYDKSGVQYHFGATSTRVIDPSGNTITYATSGLGTTNQVTTITDTIGHVVTVTSIPITTSNPAGSFSITYSDSQGTPQTITLSSAPLENGLPVSLSVQGGRCRDGGGELYVHVGTQNYNYAAQDTLTFPTGEQYVLTYSGLSEIAKIQYPSGGYTAYAYQNIPGIYLDANWKMWADIREIQSRSICAKNSGSCSPQELQTTTYTPSTGTDQNNSGNLSMEFSDPAQNVTHVDFNPSSVYTDLPVEIQRLIYSGNKSSLLRTIQSQYTSGSSGLPGITVCAPSPTAIITTLNDVSPNLTSRVEYDHQTITLNNSTFAGDICGTSMLSPNVIAKRDYGYDGSLIRTTTNAWNAYTNDVPHILDRVTSSNVSSGGFQSTHSWNYTATGLVHDETVGGTNASDSTTNYSHDTNGRLTSIQDARLNTTAYDYTPSWANTSSSCAPSLSIFPTKTTDALQHVSHATFDACTGTLHSSQDANGSIASFQYDARMRKTRQFNPDGGGTQIIYSPNAGTSITSSQALDSSRWVTSIVTHDGIGRTLTQQNTSDPNGTLTVDYTYALLGGVASVSNPHYGNAPSLYTTYGYDELGRVKNVTNADGTTKQNVYSGNTTYTVDESNNATALTSDSLGRLVSVIENASVPGQNGTSCGASCGLTTQYFYDALGNLTQVVQQGSPSENAPRTRTFTYDGISRLLTANNPETGTITYSYTLSGSPCAGDMTLPCSKTDSRSIITSYSYDALSRLIQKTYSDGTATANFGYDGKMADGTPLSSLGLPADNPIGRLSIMNVGLDYWQAYSYDSMGRIAQQTYKFPNVAQSAPVNTWYDVAGNIVNLRYPNGYLISQGWDSAGHLTSSSLTNVSGTPQTQTYLQSAQYHPDVTPASFTLGNGAVQTFDENNRLQMQSITIASAVIGSAPFFSHFYCYANCITGGGGPANNGNIWRIQDTLNSGLTQDFVYDNLNRIRQFSLGGTVYQNFAVDSFGNSSQADSNGTGIFNFDPATNRVSNMQCAAYVSPTYDSAGNQLCDLDSNGAARRYAYDAESRIKSISMASSSQPFESYTYLPDGTRIWKSNADGSSTGYINFAGQTLAEVDQNGSWVNYIYANGQKIARSESSLPIIHTHGVRDNTINMACPTVWSVTTGTVPAGYTIRPGDKFVWDQKQIVAHAGPAILFTDTNNIPATDQDGQSVSGSTQNDGLWHHRIADLSAHVGHTLSNSNNFALSTQADTPAGTWDVYYANIALISADGSVRPIFTGQQIGASLWNSCGGHDLSVATELTPVTDQSVATTFYAADHLGTTQLELAGGGWPIWKGIYSPYGMELTSLRTPNHYKFTGKERDTESGLDNFGARYYASTMGRFMSPDEFGGHTEDPQTLNKYSYVGNNPLSRTDPSGHDFWQSCDKASSTCQNQQIGTNKDGSAINHLVQGTTDSNGKFSASVVTSASLSDPNSGNSAVVNGSGVQITSSTGTSQGIFINGTPSADIKGDPNSAGWNQFSFHIDSNYAARGVLTAGTATYLGNGGRQGMTDAINALRANGHGPFQYTEEMFGNPYHPRAQNFRFSTGSYPEMFNYGPSPHFAVPKGPGDTSDFHVDSKTGPAHLPCATMGVGCY